MQLGAWWDLAATPALAFRACSSLVDLNRLLLLHTLCSSTLPALSSSALLTHPAHPRDRVTIVSPSTMSDFQWMQARARPSSQSSLLVKPGWGPGPSIENVPGSWEYWGFSRPQQRWPVLSVHPMLNGLIGNWNSAPGKLTGLAFHGAPETQGPGLSVA